MIKPDAVVLDHSPMALLALRGIPTRKILLNSGFFIPPNQSPLPLLHPWIGDPNPLHDDESRVLALMNGQLAAWNQAPLKSVAQLYADVDETALTTYPELDHYPQRIGSRYWGVLPTSRGEPPVWPDERPKKLFAYIQPFAHRGALLHAMADTGAATLMVGPPLSPEESARIDGAALSVSRKLQDLLEVGRVCTAAVLNANHYTTAQLLLAGKPVALVPTTTEQQLFAQAVERLGAGVMIDPSKPELFTAKIAALIEDPKYAQAAQAFALRHATLDPNVQLEKIVRRIGELAGGSNPMAPAVALRVDLKSAMALHQAGRLDEAARVYSALLSRNPRDADALHLMGVVMLQKGRPLDAIGWIDHAVAVKPNEAVFLANLGEALRAAGQFDRAADTCRAAIKLRPAYLEACNTLGLVLNAQGKIDEAIACFREALRHNPRMASLHCNLGNAFIQLNDRPRAINHFREAVSLEPERADAHANLCQALLEENEIAAAIEHGRDAVRLKPSMAEARNNLGNALRANGQIAEAKTCYIEALRLNPCLAMACSNMGQALQEEGAVAEAVEWYERGLVLEPNSARTRTFYAGALAEEDDHLGAQREYERVLHHDPANAEANAGLGRLQRELGRHDEARLSIREAIRLRPDLAGPRVQLGMLLEELGDLAGAEAAFREALARDPRNTVASAQLATLLRGKMPDADLSILLTQLEETGESPSRRAPLHFGLAQVLDARGDFATAAEHLEQANASRKAEWQRGNKGYDPAAHERFVDAMIAAFTPAFFEKMRGAGSISERPVFIVGLPRSSTTLTEQILASHSKVHGAGELRYMRETFDSLPKELDTSGTAAESVAQLTSEISGKLALDYLARLAGLSETAARVVEKMPDNYLYLGLIATLFPRAKIIHCRRDLRDIAVSCWMTNFGSIRWACDKEWIASRFAQYRRIMEHWKTVLPSQVLESNYEELVASPEPSARRLVEWVGLEWEPGCLEFHETARPVKTASVTQVRQPIYKRSVERWRNYEAPLGDLFARLV